MTEEMLEHIEAHIIRMEGNLMHGRRVLLLSKLIAKKDGLEYDDDILTFAAYFHDVAVYPYYRKLFSAEFDHALESSRLIPELAREYGFSDIKIEIIVEATRFHNKANMGIHNETKLIRNADGVDYLGYMAVARDFSKFPGDFGKVLKSLKRRKDQFFPLIDLPYAKELAVPRVKELEEFIRRFEEECLGVL